MLKIVIKSKLVNFYLLTVVLLLSLFNAHVIAQNQDEAEKQGKDIYEKYQTAIGGKENIDKIKSIETITEYEIVGIKRKDFRIDDKVSKKWYLMIEGGIEGKQESGFDGSRNWSRNNSFRGYRDNALRVAGGVTKQLKLPNEKIDGKEYLVVNEVSESRNFNVKTYYDVDSFLLFQRKINLDIGGNQVEQTITYTDYQKVGDILVAFLETTKTPTATIARRKTSVKHNIEIDPSIFELEIKEKKEEKKTEQKEEEKNSKTEWDKKNPEAIVPENIKKETLEKVWKTINETYWDSTFNGVDWNAVKAKYEPQLTDVKTNQNLTDLLNKMIGELKQSHLKVMPAGQVVLGGSSNIELPKVGSIGIETRWINKSDLVVKTVREKSPAEEAGIKKGYLIKKIDGEKISEIIENQRKKGGFQMRDEIVAVRASNTKLLGDLAKKVSVTFIDENNVEKTIELSRQNFGVSRELTFESKQLNENVGYIKFNIFIGDLPKKFEEAIATISNKKALIIDLRGNPGGVGNHTIALAGMLDKEKRSLGVSQFRYNKQQFAYEGSDKSFKGKVFILVDELSASSAEILAAGLQSNKRATVIGQNSAGAVLPSTMEILPNGGALQYAIGDYKTPDGKVLEGRGVTPDLEVKLSRKDLLEGKDTFLEAALNLTK